jgi:aspartyl protease family protein
MKALIWISLFFSLLIKPVAAQQNSVKVVALFNNKALLMVNGEQKLVRKGEVFNGVELLSSTSRGALIGFSDGKQKMLNINQSISQGFIKPDKSKVTVYANQSGMFMIQGKINGHTTNFLLDTGATTVAISQTDADKLGLPYESSQRKYVSTASEIVPVWSIKLDHVTVGDIGVANVDAVVLEGSQPHTPLLGMTFLQHLKLKRNGSMMTLEQKY